MTIYTEKVEYKPILTGKKGVNSRKHQSQGTRVNGVARAYTYVNDFYGLRVGILPLCNTGDVAKQKLAGFMRPESGTRTVFQ